MSRRSVFGRNFSLIQQYTQILCFTAFEWFKSINIYLFVHLSLSKNINVVDNISLAKQFGKLSLLNIFKFVYWEQKPSKERLKSVRSGQKT